MEVMVATSGAINKTRKAPVRSSPPTTNTQINISAKSATKPLVNEALATISREVSATSISTSSGFISLEFGGTGQPYQATTTTTYRPHKLR